MCIRDSCSNINSALKVEKDYYDFFEYSFLGTSQYFVEDVKWKITFVARKRQHLYNALPNLASTILDPVGSKGDIALTSVSLLQSELSCVSLFEKRQKDLPVRPLHWLLGFSDESPRFKQLARSNTSARTHKYTPLVSLKWSLKIYGFTSSSFIPIRWRRKFSAIYFRRD